MRILHIISGDLWAGAEVQAFTLLAALKKSPEVEVAVVLMNEGELAERLRAQNIAVTVLPENTMGMLSLLFALRTLMQQWQPDIVHTHRIKENILGSIANLIATNAGSVRTIHGATESSAPKLYKLHKHLLTYLNLWTGQHLQKNIIAVSRELGEKLAPIFPAAKISIIENGVDIAWVRSQIQPVDFKTNQPDAIHIGIVGRLVPVKRIDVFLETAALLQNEFPQHHWNFHIIGSGPLEKSLLEQAQQLKISRHVTFHGHRTDIIACIAALDVLVMCSDHEGLPMTLLEALALRKPVIGHAVGGINSTLQLVDATRLVHTQTPREFANAILREINHPTANSSSHQWHTFEQRFSSENNLQQTLALYRSGLKSLAQ